MKSFYLIIFLFLGSFAFSQTNQVPAWEDTTYAIIPLDTNQYVTWAINRNAATTLSQKEMIYLDNLVNNAIYDNQTGKSGGIFKIRNAPYFKQVVPSINANGEKIIYVNGVCVPEKPYKPYDEELLKVWRNHLYIVNDGGSCYWHMLINLTARTYEVPYVNGP